MTTPSTTSPYTADALSRAPQSSAMETLGLQEKWKPFRDNRGELPAGGGLLLQVPGDR